ncbi:hypothetical protein [Paraburkholderia sacchari]|uniref:hypothetical protein n=1 Tax=Paraburkholderia sacchari TaxID=159450 RepID=UPI001BD126A2|nr:hypothetical protein [Paraburkholderia sacchari]
MALNIFRRAPSLTLERKRDLAYDMLCVRTARRQRQAKSAMRHRGVEPRVLIGSGYVPANVARVFTHCKVA